MYTAIQAKNISEERSNHKYYKLYRRYVKDIMKGIMRSADCGETDLCYYVKYANKSDFNILNQIAKELRFIGYECRVSAEKEENNKRYCVYINWGRENNGKALV